MRISLLTLALLAAEMLFAQQAKKDVVYLKNGSIIRGSIVMEDPGKLIKLKTSDKSLWVFKYDQIDSIKHTDKEKVQLKTGYFNLTEIGVLAGNSNNVNKNAFMMMNISS